jgi:TRAP-type C4-dicarboxylate transport system permease small subunit
MRKKKTKDKFSNMNFKRISQVCCWLMRYMTIIKFLNVIARYWDVAGGVEGGLLL